MVDDNLSQMIFGSLGKHDKVLMLDKTFFWSFMSTLDKLQVWASSNGGCFGSCKWAGSRGRKRNMYEKLNFTLSACLIY